MSVADVLSLVPTYRFTLKCKWAPKSTDGVLTAAPKVNLFFMCIHTLHFQRQSWPVLVICGESHLRCVSSPGAGATQQRTNAKRQIRGNWGFNNQRPGARRDQWFQMEVQGQREGGQGGGGGGSNHSAASVRSQRRSERAKNAPGVRSSWPDISCPPTPFHTRVTCWSSDPWAALQPVPYWTFQLSDPCFFW